MFKEGKTWKRELGVVILVWMMWLAHTDIEALKVVSNPSFIYLGLAFGLDWWGKATPDSVPQIPQGGSK